MYIQEARSDNRELKRVAKNASQEFEGLKKKIEALEKNNLKLEKEKYEKEDLIRQAMEIVDEVIAKSKKDGNNGHVLKSGKH